MFLTMLIMSLINLVLTQSNLWKLICKLLTMLCMTGAWAIIKKISGASKDTICIQMNKIITLLPLVASGDELIKAGLGIRTDPFRYEAEPSATDEEKAAATSDMALIN